MLSGRRDPELARLASRVRRLSRSLRRLPALGAPATGGGAWQTWEARLFERVLDELREQHREALQDWRDIESKAQATAATAGAAVAVLANFIREPQLAQAPALGRWLLGGATVLAMLSLLLALNALLVRKIAFGDGASQLKADGIRVIESGEIAERTTPLLHDLVLTQEHNADEYGKVHDAKARSLQWAQLLLGLSLFVLGSFAVWVLAK